MGLDEGVKAAWVHCVEFLPCLRLVGDLQTNMWLVGRGGARLGRMVAYTEDLHVGVARADGGEGAELEEGVDIAEEAVPEEEIYDTQC